MSIDTVTLLRGLKRSTTVHARSKLVGALEHAIDRGVIPDATLRTKVRPDPTPEGFDPADADAPPPALDAAQVSALIAASGGTRWEPILILLGTRGLRRGEALGLAWDCIDLDAGTIRIARQLTRLSGDGRVVHQLGIVKTAAGKRVLALDPRAVSSLRRWTKQQTEERLARGVLWQAPRSGPATCFTDDLGRSLSHDALRSALETFSRRAGIDQLVNPHLLRHSAGSIALANGASIADVSKMLGHSNVAITMRTYLHSLDQQSSAAGGAVDSAIDIGGIGW